MLECEGYSCTHQDKEGERPHRPSIPTCSCLLGEQNWPKSKTTDKAAVGAKAPARGKLESLQVRKAVDEAGYGGS